MKTYNFTLRQIEVSKIDLNPDNPRGSRVRDNDTQFDYLKRSIKQFGLIVPLVVKKTKDVGEKYRLIDGDRRYWALKELGIKEAPAHVITGEINDNERKNVMFHIHTNRTNWDACQYCRALEPFYEDLADKFKGNERKIANELIRLTGTNKRTINDRLNFLRWPKDVKGFVYNERPELYWTIVEIEGGIIKPAEKNFPEYFRKVPKDDVRKYLLRKYIEGTVHASTEARKVKYIVRTTKENKEQYEYAFEIFKKLVDQVDYTFEEAKEEFLSRFPEAETVSQLSVKKLYNQLSRLATILKEYDVSWLRTATKRQKTDFVEILDELEESLKNFKKDFQEHIGGN